MISFTKTPTLTFDQWGELWLRHVVNQGMHVGLALSVLDDMRQATAEPRATLPRVVTQGERYVVVELPAENYGARVAIYCRRCRSTSFNANEVQQLYCSHCKQFHI